MMIIKELLNGFVGIFYLIFNMLGEVVGLENITKSALANGEDPIYGYILLGIFSLLIIATFMYAAAVLGLAFARHMYMKEMQWRKLQEKRKARISHIENL